MRLTEKAITAISNLDMRLELAKTLGFTETWIRALIDKNKENGPLTTMKAIQAIKSKTGLKDKEILLEEESIRA